MLTWVISNVSTPIELPSKAFYFSLIVEFLAEFSMLWSPLHGFQFCTTKRTNQGQCKWYTIISSNDINRKSTRLVLWNHCLYYKFTLLCNSKLRSTVTKLSSSCPEFQNCRLSIRFIYPIALTFFSVYFRFLALIFQNKCRQWEDDTIPRACDNEAGYCFFSMVDFILLNRLCLIKNIRRPLE